MLFRSGKGTVSRISKEMEGIKRIILVIILPSFLLMIKSQLSVKLALGNLTMLSRSPNS